MRQRFSTVMCSVRLSALLKVVCLGLWCSIISVSALHAQAVYGSIGGVILDSSGGAVTSAKITITDTDRGVVFTTQSDSSGRYDERHLIAGHYQVKIEAQGFKSVASKIDVSVDTLATFDATLQPGTVSETINVVDEVPLLKTERTDVSTVLSTRQVNELPTYGRNFSQLLLVTPGTVQFCWGDTSTENPQSGLAVNVNGQMFVGDNTILDGTDDRDFLYGNMLIVPNLDSIAETKVTTSSYDAEFGQISAALITVSTKSGTDHWHGSGFFYRRSDATFARDPFAQATPDPVTGRYIPPTLWGQFGGSIGGAIIKDKLFIFGDYQGTRAHDGGSALAVVPTQAERSGDFSAWATNNPIYNPLCSASPGEGLCVNGIQDNLNDRPQFQYNGRLNVIDPSLISPVATALLNYVPLPIPALENAPGYQPGQPNYAGGGDEIYHADAIDARADYFYSDKLRLFDRYTFTQFHKEAPGLFGGAVAGPQLNPIGYTGVGDTRPQSNSFGVSYAIRPTLLMDARFGWYKQRINVNPLVTGDFATQAGAPGLNIPSDPTTNSMPHFSIQEGPGELDFGNGLYDNCNCPLVERMQQFQGIGNLTWTVGKHTFKFGPDIHRLQNLRLPSDEHRSGEVYTYDALTEGENGGGLGMAGFLLGETSQFQRYISHTDNAGERQWRYFFYGQDTWRVTSKLTLNYGLRWEIYRPQTVTGKDDGGWFNLANGEIDVAGENGVPLSGPVVTNWKNLAPRVGIAYQATPKTVVRMGYGRSFDVGMFGTIFGHTVTQNLPVLGTQQINPLPNPQDGAFNLAVGPPLLDPVTVLNNQPVGPDGNHIYPDGFRAWVMPFHTHMPTVDSWNATVQRQITPTLSLQAAYVGNKGSHIFVGENNWINLNTQTEAGFCSPTILAENPVPSVCLSAQDRLPFYNSPNPFHLTTGLQCMCNPGDNHYNSLQVQLDKRFSHGLNILGNYTFSHAKNHDSPDFLYDPAIEYGRPAWQRNQNITVSTIYELPFGKGKALAGNSPTVLNDIIGGWQLVNVTTIMSGSGVNPGYNEWSNDNDAGVSFPNVVGSWHVAHPNRNGWFATTALVGGSPTPLNANGQISGPWQRPAAPAPGSPSFGNAQRDSIIGPKWFDSDLSVVKNVPIREEFSVQFRAEAFNVFNHPNLGNPNSCVDCFGAGTITSTANNSSMRKMQFGLRFDF
jgi:Carboxypeptidase regulatory-like domain/TonB dependent receptor